MSRYQKLDDANLCKLYVQKKDNKAFDELFQRYFEPVYRYVYSRVGNRTWSDDITSETFIALTDLIQNYKSQYKLKTYIIGIAINKIKQFWSQKHMRDHNISDENFIIDDDVDEISKEINLKKKKKIIKNILNKLPLKYRNVLQKRFIEGKNIKETSIELNISEQNVKTIQNRAIKKAISIGGNLYEKK